VDFGERDGNSRHPQALISFLQASAFRGAGVSAEPAGVFDPRGNVRLGLHFQVGRRSVCLNDWFK
jgi:hypothetical protein